MSTAFPLPLECLQLVIRFLATQDDTHSLATLLRVNKYVCSATLPFLYEGPLLLPVLTGYCFENSALARRLNLITTLLLGVPEVSLSDLLKVTFRRMPVSTESPQLLFAPYHSFVTGFLFSQSHQLYEAFFQKNVRQPDQRLVDHIALNGLEGRFIAEDPLGRISDEANWDAVSSGFDRQISADLTWALCSNAERIKSLTVPLSEIANYLSIVPRFKVLSDVSFHFDRRVQYVQDDAPDELSPQELEVLRKHEKERTEHLEAMIFFVQEHRRCHNNVLRTATCPRAPPFYEDCSAAYEARLNQSLPPLLNPQFLDSRNWTQFASKVQETNLSSVKTITQPSVAAGRHEFNEIVKQIPFLHRCRALDTVHLGSLISDMFQWAVDERKNYNAKIAAGQDLSPQPLVPLRELTAQFVLPSQDEQINGIAFAFGDTLERLRVHGCLFKAVDVHHQPTVFAIGQEPGLPSSSSLSPCWHVPKLSYLYVDFLHNFVRIHPRLFARSSRLAIVVLMDRRNAYSTRDIERWESAELEHLESLLLMGTPAVSFHPDSLTTTVNLRYLGLKIPNAPSSNHPFIPPLAELDDFEDDDFAGSAPSPRRPIWTWDWDLPKLTDLDLTGEFAYRFQFRMLRGTPGLVHFLVDIRSASSEHKRTVSIKDLVKSTQDGKTTETLQDDDNDDDTRNSQLEYIHLPDLRKFSLIGPWTFDKQVLAILCSKVAPNMSHLTLQGCSGFGLAEWVNVTSEYLYGLVEAVSSVPIERSSREEVEEVGLVADLTDHYVPNGYKLKVPPPSEQAARHSGRYLFV
ncbi:hypothetical protein BG015_008404 [Linnemannia schmuckeri]|uniref:Uncharacterized protein n=1 Tax=Linnemannia schmuckeri TaxID=64567 RepID=A0A9P5S8G5_9FUNG|nr:hypothetical protein BG015_008404 [Linnemannia schmuckeri]